MQSIINDKFILKSDTAVGLFEACKDMPIIDFHNHLNPEEIYEDKTYTNLTEVWLGGDHYKWRAMRAAGYSEKLVTGNADPYDKFLAYADTIQRAIGNPLYHWTHLELARYFDIHEALTPESAPDIWKTACELLPKSEYSVRNLLRMQNVEVLCTTDDPADDLCWHKKIREDGFEIKVCPSFRPEKALGIEKADYKQNIERLASVSRKNISLVAELISALESRLDYFVENGCHITDHSLEGSFCIETSEAEVNDIMGKAMNGETITDEECGKYKGYVLTALGRMYAARDLAMQLHIGAIRNNSARLYTKLGADCGVDSIHDFSYAAQLSRLLNAMDVTDELPRTVLYYLNPKDAAMLAAMAGNFQENSKGIRGKVQLGSAWWFCDHKNGMEDQMDRLADVGMLSTFIGMLTDSRSFLSFPRHEYFRRILCNKIGTWAENGEYPKDMNYLTGLVKDICYYNSKKYLNL